MKTFWVIKGRNLILLFMLFLSSFSYTQESVINATGMAVGTDLSANDEALNRAMRKAIEMGVGSIIDSETMVENYQLLDDQVYSHVKGYVKSYEVINEEVTADGITKVTIRAVVALGMLQKDIKALKITWKRRGNPRIMFIFSEIVDGLEQAGAVTQTTFENAFLKKDFPLIDKSQLQSIKERDAAMNYADPLKAAELGRRFGAEIVVVGQATSDLVDSSRPYGVSVFAYEATISAKAIKTDSAEMMASDQATAVARGGGRIPTARDSLRNASNELADRLMRQIVERARSEAFNRVNVQLIGDKAGARNRRDFMEELSQMRGIFSVNERSFGNGISIMDVEMDGALWKDFELKLESLRSVMIRVSGKSPDRIEFDFIAKPRPIPLPIQKQKLESEPIQ